MKATAVTTIILIVSLITLDIMLALSVNPLYSFRIDALIDVNNYIIAHITPTHIVLTGITVIAAAVIITLIFCELNTRRNEK